MCGGARARAVLVRAEDVKGLDKRVRPCACVLDRRAAEGRRGRQRAEGRGLDEEGKGHRPEALRVARRGT